MDQLAAVLGSMDVVVTWLETYRALLESRGFSRECAEALTIHYSSVICAQLILRTGGESCSSSSQSEQRAAS